MAAGTYCPIGHFRLVPGFHLCGIRECEDLGERSVWMCVAFSDSPSNHSSRTPSVYLPTSITQYQQRSYQLKWFPMRLFTTFRQISSKVKPYRMCESNRFLSAYFLFGSMIRIHLSPVEALVGLIIEVTLRATLTQRFFKGILQKKSA